MGLNAHRFQTMMGNDQLPLMIVTLCKILTVYRLIHANEIGAIIMDVHI